MIGGTTVGVLDHDLRSAALAALKLTRLACRDFAFRHSWQSSTKEFLQSIAPLRSTTPSISGLFGGRVPFEPEAPNG